MMSQGRALRIPDREKPAGFNGRQRKRLNQEKVKTRQRKGWERNRDKGKEKDTLRRKKGGTDSSGEDRILSSDHTAFQTCSCTLQTSLSFRCLR